MDLLLVAICLAAQLLIQSLSPHLIAPLKNVEYSIFVSVLGSMAAIILLFRYWCRGGRMYRWEVAGLIAASLPLIAVGLAYPYHSSPRSEWVISTFDVRIVAFVALYCFTGSVLEEVVFRGWILSFLQKRINAFGAVVLSALAFAFVHGAAAGVMLFLCGIVLACITIITKSIVVAVFCHFINNFFYRINGDASIFGFNLPYGRQQDSEIFLLLNGAAILIPYFVLAMLFFSKNALQRIKKFKG